MVSIEHGMILHGVDSARPILHEPIVHESVLQKRFNTSSILHRFNCAPVNIKKNCLIKSHFFLASQCIYNARKLDIYS